MNDQSDVESRVDSSRREFLKATASAGLVAGLAPAVHGAGTDTVRVALVGCGGRGTGAAANVLQTKANTRLVAMADAFADRIDLSLRGLAGQVDRDCLDVPEDRRFVGLDGYQHAIDSGVDLVLLCTPPGFRPLQFEAAVRAGKHVFLEKPVATDAPGVRRVLAANEEAKSKGLAVAVGHHLRHEEKHQDIIERIHDGAIGDLRYLRAYFNSTGVWVRPREPGQTEMQYQVRNWYYFTWLSGDHIVEQHVHDLDVCNWIKGSHPVEAQGVGGRQVRVGKEYGEIFDHHTVEFTYDDGVKLFSFCRHMPGCWNSFSQHAHGTHGSADIEGHGTATLQVAGQEPRRWRRDTVGHQVEMDELVEALQSSRPYNEGDYGAMSTMTAILGRAASYSGKIVRWDEAFSSDIELVPRHIAWNTEPPLRPGPDGIYVCAMPGITKAL